MKNIGILVALTLVIGLGFSGEVAGQKSHGDMYQPEADAMKEIEKLVSQAKEEGKHLILQVGGNWCGWCYRFHDFVEGNEEIKAIVHENYLIYHLNYSKENKNEAALAKYRFPQRFGFPVFVILDADGQLLHTQDSALLESGEGYDATKVKNFFKSWTAAVLDPASY